MEEGLDRDVGMKLRLCMEYSISLNMGRVYVAYVRLLLYADEEMLAKPNIQI